MDEMARKKQPPQPQRAEDQTQISITLPKTLLAQVNAAAAADKRSRSNWIVVQLEKAVEEGGADGPEKKLSILPPAEGAAVPAPRRRSA